MTGEMGYLDEALQSYSRSDVYPLHMPGHKRRLGSLPDPYRIDITETEGMDNLHHAEGILLQAQERANALYGADRTYYLVGGSTAGILAALHTVSAMNADTGRRKILFARNSHKAAYHGLYLSRLEPVYLYPSLRRGIAGAVSAEDVETALQTEEGIAAVFVTSPTYDGIVSDIASITRIAHRHQVPVIVDEAHGAHFGLHPGLPAGSASLGADLVIHSLHKTLPSLTQTALLHHNGSLVDEVVLARFLQIYQTTSPSYVLMASMEQCIRIMQTEGEALLTALLDHIRELDEAVGRLRHIRRIRTDDPTKLLFTDGTGRLSGLQICDILRKNYHLEPEMAAPLYVLCLTSVGDDRDGFLRLAHALEQIDRMLSEQTSGQEAEEETPQAQAERAHVSVPLFEAWDREAQTILLEESAGRISGEFAYLYPPGIPLLVPGEEITPRLLKQLLALRECGFSLQGMRDAGMKEIRVVLMKRKEETSCWNTVMTHSC